MINIAIFLHLWMKNWYLFTSNQWFSCWMGVDFLWRSLVELNFTLTHECMHQQICDIIPMLNWCRFSIVDGGPTLIQQYADVPWMMGMPHVKSPNISLHVRWSTRRDDDLWMGVVDQSQSDMPSFKWLTAQPAVTALPESDVQHRRFNQDGDKK